MSTVQSYEDWELLSKISQGDELAFGELFYKYGALIHPVVLKIVKDKAVAEDVIADLFLKLWLHRAKLAEVNNIRGYLNRLAINISINCLRRDKLQDTVLHKIYLDVPAGNNEVELQVSANELRGVINRAVQALPEQRRKVYELSRHEGLDRSAIAARLGISENTVKNQLRLALRFIQEFLAREYGLSLTLLLILKKM